ncbi:Uncharacterised protein [Mycobacteroides abscessus subsp. abscessus]|nr:Uncharacterised protein [Mycobacteroides abscessus subsp. abscessus]
MRYAVQKDTSPYPAACDLLNAYPANGRMVSHKAFTAFSEKPLLVMPS